MSAAVRARECGASVLVLDDNLSAGGQIWRGGRNRTSGGQSSFWFRKLVESGAEVIAGARIVDADAKRRCVIAEAYEDSFAVEYGKLILTTGARELFLPFPGWTISNVMGAGGLQALVKSGLPVAGKRIIVAGSGPLLLAVAAYLRHHGAEVPIIAEQARRRRLNGFLLRLTARPRKLFQAALLRFALRRSRYLASCWVEAANGKDRLESVRLRRGGRVWDEPCDYLAIGFGFKSNIELPALMNCRIRDGAVEVDEAQQTSQQGIYCAGECTGIGGVDLAIVEGEIAGYAAAGRHEFAARLLGKRSSARRFASAMERAFALRDELRSLASGDTIVCRCEDVAWQRLESMESWRSAKLHTRCGMGPCQGRVCGPILEFLLGLQPESVRPPVFPARVETLVLPGE
jgi:NADPH-dependent 2,4-dienoyl-CoA reductase/sulfur reductase-like enzyme